MAEAVLRCYRSACNNAAHPAGYSRITHGLYCLDCAHRIERVRGRRGGWVMTNPAPIEAIGWLKQHGDRTVRAVCLDPP